jgi:hypothetical protein
MKSEDNQLDDLIGNLDQDITPSRDLWSGIEQAVTQIPQEAEFDRVESTIGKTQWMKVAAMFAPVALVSGIWFGQTGGSEPQYVEPNWLKPVSASFELQKKQLLQRVSDSTVISPNWRTSLSELESAEKALKKALTHQPEDPALMKMLTQIHQQQLDLINKTHQFNFSQI